MPNDLLTSFQVAVELECSVRTVHRHVDAGRLIPSQKLPGRNGAWLFDRAAVEMFRRTKAAA